MHGAGFGRPRGEAEKDKMKALEFIKARYLSTGLPPTMQEVSMEFKVSYGCAQKWILWLEVEGHLEAPIAGTRYAQRRIPVVPANHCHCCARKF